MFEIITSEKRQLRISVMGIGGCGCNTVSMLHNVLDNENVNLVAINTDNAVLNHCEMENKILIGESLTKGYGAGADPAVGLEAAKESESQIREQLEESDIVIITTGLGGGTGTGASPYVAGLAKEQGKPCISVATLPFGSEGAMRMGFAEDGLRQLRGESNALVTLPNDSLIASLGESVGLFDAFRHSNEVLNNVLKSLVDMLTSTGMINVDLNDFCKIMSHSGDAILGVGRCDTEGEAHSAVVHAIGNPLVKNMDLANARGVIVQLNCREEISLGSYNSLTSFVREQLSATALMICGVSLAPEQECGIEILVMATGLSESEDAGRTNKSLVANDETERARPCQVADKDLLHIPTFIRQLNR